MDTAVDVPARPDPAIMRGVIPYLAMQGAAGEAIEIWSRAYGAREIARIPLPEDPARLMHAHVEINGGSVMMSDAGCMGGSQRDIRGLTLQLILSDAEGDRWWQRAVDAGCTVVDPLERVFWGSRYGRLRDPLGIAWAFNVEG